MEIVTGIVTPVVESLMIPVKKHASYLLSCTKYVRDMGTKMRELNATRLDVEDHMNRNKSNCLKVPIEVRGWLEKVEKIEAQVENINPVDVGGRCFNLRVRHKLGRKAFKIIQEINRLKEEKSRIDWTDHPIPLGKVDSMKASTTSTPSSHHNDFKSREPTFTEALKALQPDHKCHMIALCGMGGVGKTIMMQKLKKVVSEKKMFDFIIEAVIGEKMEVSVIQQAVADFLGIDLKESSEAARAIKLRKGFEAHSNGGKKTFLVMLDDVWQFVDLNDIGLSCLPNQGVNFKVLLTSRDRDVCTMMGVEVDFILNVEVIEDMEAQNFFLQFVKKSDEDDLDLDLRKIGNDIAIRCHGLPIAIKTIARSLIGKSKLVWEDTRSRLEDKDVDRAVHQVFEISYNYLPKEETRSILLLCGLFHEDLDIPMEDLVRCGWGLKIFDNVNTIRKARNRLNTCIERLIHANLLIPSEDVGCVKVHDLVRAFVLDMCSSGEHASVVGNMSNWPTKHRGESCKRLSLTCAGMPEFPRDRKYPNLMLLKLMHGDNSLKFPEDYYEEMKKLEVIAFERMKNPLIPTSLQYSNNLRMLCLHQCTLMFDCSSIGNLLNLEVLDFSHSSITKLPTTIGNLKELKILDLTDCSNLCIDEGVLKNLVKLEELYVRGARLKAADDELVECSRNLGALEIEFFGNKPLPKNMSFEKLERFKISLGCSLEDHYRQNRHSFENMLMLVTNKCDLLDSKMNELFEKTKVLHLEVDGINDLGVGLVESLHHHHQFPFYNLRVLHIRKCANLRYLFTIRVVDSLKQLERLEIFQCPVLETLVDSENCEVEVIKFPALKFLSLEELPMLMSFCEGGNVIELPQLEVLILDSLPNFTSKYQHLLNKEVMISKLKKLKICNMEKLKEIWSSQLSNNDELICQLRELTVHGCDRLVNLFPSNPMSLLHHLEQLTVTDCGSIDVLFNIDLGCVGEIQESSSNLRSIEIRRLGELRDVWRVINGVNNSNDDLPILGFQCVEYIKIEDCKRLRNVFTPTTSNFDMRALKEITIDGYDGWGENEMVESSQQMEEINVVSNEYISEVDDDDIPNVAFPSYLIHTFHSLRTLFLSKCKGAEVAFEIDGPISSRKLATRNNQQPLLLPYLEVLQLNGMDNMTHVWKYDWIQFLVSQQEPKSFSFHNLTRIRLTNSKRIKYLFSPLMAKFLPNLKSIDIQDCGAIEEVVSNRDDENEEMATSISSHTNTTFFPHLDFIMICYLQCLKRIDGLDARCGGTSNNTITSTSVQDTFQCSQMGVGYWSLCQYLKSIYIEGCDALLNVIPSHAEGQMPNLEKLIISNCMSMREIFGFEGVNNNVGDDTIIGDRSRETDTAITIIPRLRQMTSLVLPNLKILQIEVCYSLEYVFTSSTLESLKKLEELKIKGCSSIQVIVKEEIGEHIITLEDVVFPRLKSLTLVNLENLKSFFSAKNNFRWPLLDKVKIYGCPQMMIFTCGRSMAPKLKYVNTSLGKHSLECGLNFDWTNAPHQRNQLIYNASRCSTAYMKKLLQFPWSFSNLIEMDVDDYHVLSESETIFPCNEFLKRQSFGNPDAIEEAQNIFKGTKDELIETQVNIRNSNWWTASNLSNLTKVSIRGWHCLQHVFSYGIASSLVQLQELHISRCDDVEVIVEQVQDSETKATEVCFPRLKSLQLGSLSSLKGFCLGSEAFQWPSLDMLKIINCPRVTVFTNGHSTAQKLKVIETSFGWCDATEDLNYFIRTKIQEGYKF